MVSDRAKISSFGAQVKLSHLQLLFNVVKVRCAVIRCSLHGLLSLWEPGRCVGGYEVSGAGLELSLSLTSVSFSRVAGLSSSPSPSSHQRFSMGRMSWCSITY
jgi:hypothetical protein